ncbi:galactoside O-acetyltransferase [Companilactobacillus tucceti DSM 20183]|uniref:Galactoside O-acetyltransferase n=1 Tax=Companilactobacillus tucceti DSM 20183 TaxID=1423811 RepID=A0A0R1J9P1_9LACO|nr:sugar O-acetyltransferase [Companilactobacillus tucceti]KRK65715.1 galactoside O-acetyltransferase [Companilactobacillus tucceti DSM 20183]
MKTEKEKFLAGEPYQIMDSELAADETRARRLCKILNNLDDAAVSEKDRVIRQLFGSVGKSPYIQPNFRCDFGYNIHVGDNFLCNYDNVILDIAPVTIGDHCLMAPHAQIYAAYHPYDPVERANFIGLGKPVTIGDNVWIGANAVILPGVTLGNNVIVGANSTVTKSFGDNVIIAGSPAKVLRKNMPKD